jgi:hypothetical protein
MSEARTFAQDTWLYVRRMDQFRRADWWVYFMWVGQIFSLFLVILTLMVAGHNAGARFPAYAWNLPIGTFIFAMAIAIDTIGHRTVYAEALKTGEELVHHITIAAGISSCVLLCLAYANRGFFAVPALVMTFLSVFYSAIDEAMHWFRFHAGNSDRVEMWSHFFIFVGHLIMMSSWVWWFLDGYPGVAEAIQLLHLG